MTNVSIINQVNQPQIHINIDDCSTSRTDYESIPEMALTSSDNITELLLDIIDSVEPRELSLNSADEKEWLRFLKYIRSKLHDRNQKVIGLYCLWCFKNRRCIQDDDGAYDFLLDLQSLHGASKKRKAESSMPSLYEDVDEVRKVRRT